MYDLDFMIDLKMSISVKYQVPLDHKMVIPDLESASCRICDF